jgi:hypothetical protein
MGYSVWLSHRLVPLGPRDLPMDQCPILLQTPAIPTCSRACRWRDMRCGGLAIAVFEPPKVEPRARIVARRIC